MNYQLANGGNVQRLDDGAVIPADAGNVDWQKYQAWLLQGNTPLDAPVPITQAPALTVDALANLLVTKGTFSPADLAAAKAAKP